MRERNDAKVDETQEKAAMVSGIMHTIQLHNDFIDLVENPSGISIEEARTRYAHLYGTLGNMHELNQHMMRNLDDIACYLYDIAEELQGYKG